MTREERRGSSPSPGVVSEVAGVALASVSTAVAFIVGVGLVWLRQERIVWQPPRVRDADRGTPQDVTRLDYSADDGQPLFAYVVRPPAGAADGGAGADARARADRVVIAFHGNAELARWSVPWAREVARRTGQTVVLPEYRGYAGLPGAPNYDCSRRDARAAYAATLRHLDALAEGVTLFGHSLGTAVAAELADDAARAGTPPRALVLQAPFTSAKAMARVVVSPHLERWWERISRVHFDTEARVAELDVPVWVAHGQLDLIIPVGMGRRVHARARVPRELLIVGLAAHNDVPSAAGERYWAWLARALDDAPAESAAGLR